MKISMNRSKEQRDAWSRIIQIGNSMLVTTDRGELFDLFCEADDLWNEYFPFEAAQEGDGWWLAKRFNTIDRALAWLEGEKR